MGKVLPFVLPEKTVLYGSPLWAKLVGAGWRTKTLDAKTMICTMALVAKPRVVAP